MKLYRFENYKDFDEDSNQKINQEIAMSNKSSENPLLKSDKHTKEENMAKPGSQCSDKSERFQDIDEQK